MWTGKGNILRKWYTLYVTVNSKNNMSIHNLDKIRKQTISVREYLLEVSSENPIFKQKYDEYRIDKNIIRKLSEHADNTMIVSFSAEWCKDCHNNIPALDHISDATGIEVRVFGHLMRDAKGSKRRWRIPPSPVEVDEFNVIKIPHIVILTQKGESLGEIIENPQEGVSLEKAILDILEQ